MNTHQTSRHVPRHVKSYTKKGLQALTFSVLLLTGCIPPPVSRLAQTHPQGTAFTQHLAREYLIFASRESYTYYDQISAVYFARKGLAAAKGEETLPEDLRTRALPNTSVTELAEARQALLLALQSAATQDSPQELARAQVNFDCWVEEQEENYQPENIAFCRNNYLHAMAIVTGAITPSKTRTSEAPTAHGSGEYLVPTTPHSIYYRTGETSLPTDGMEVINSLKMLINAAGTYRLVVDGHADRVGSRLTNLHVTEKRDHVVNNVLVSQGIPSEKVRTFDHGAIMLEGKKGASARDRRVDITLFVPPEQQTTINARVKQVVRKPKG